MLVDIGMVHMSRTVTYTSSSLPKLELSRTSLQPMTQKRAREVNEYSASPGGDPEGGSPPKQPKLIDDDDYKILIEDDVKTACHGSLSP